MSGRQTVLFVDEVHRFNKAQQDALLPAVENRWVTFIGATTENPFFSVVSPLLSRSLLLTLDRSSTTTYARSLERAVADPRGLGGRVRLRPEALAHLGTAGRRRRPPLPHLPGGPSALLEGLDIDRRGGGSGAVDKAAVRYDRQGDQHYDVTSAFIKSMRGSDADAALHYLARMIEAGRTLASSPGASHLRLRGRRNGRPQLLCRSRWRRAQAVEFIGLPEGPHQPRPGGHPLRAGPQVQRRDQSDRRGRRSTSGAAWLGKIPAHLRDAHYPGAADLGHGKGYRYPHDYEHGLVAQEYAPPEVRERRYYRPTRHGAEAAFADRWHKIRTFIRGKDKKG